MSLSHVRLTGCSSEGMDMQQKCSLLNGADWNVWELNYESSDGSNSQLECHSAATQARGQSCHEPSGGDRAHRKKQKALAGWLAGTDRLFKASRNTSHE